MQVVDMNMKSANFKVCFLGAQGVGKTSLAIRCVSDTFRNNITPTIGASYFTFTTMVDNFNVKFQIWDTAGQERFKSMAPLYYRKAQAAILVYDVTSGESFNEINTWLTDLQNHMDEAILLCLMGNKCDLKQARLVDQERAQTYASGLGAMHFETSALNKEGIEDAFVAIAKRLIQTNAASRSRSKSAFPLRPSDSVTLDGAAKKKKKKWYACCIR